MTSTLARCADGALPLGSLIGIVAPAGPTSAERLARMPPGADAAPAPLARPGVAEGRLVGGNLSLTAALQGTPFAWPVQGTVLFLEDVNEEPYRIDRLRTQLQLAGVLEGAAGFVLGSFTQETDPTPVLLDRLGTLGKPLLAGWPAGHGAVNRPLPLGLRVRLDAGARTITLLEGWGGAA